MPIAVIEFRPGKPLSAEEAIALFEQTAPRYLGLPDLVRKHYFRRDAGDVVGAIYEWRSRAAGEAVYAGEWRERVVAHYGAEPQIIWLETPIVVDNLTRQIIKS